MKVDLRPDIDMRDYFNTFINNILINKSKEQAKLDKINANINEIYQYLTPRKGIIADKYNLRLDKYSEFVNKISDNNLELYNDVNKIYKHIDINEDKSDIIQLIKLVNFFNTKKEIQNKIDYYEKCSNINKIQFRDIVSEYYYTVHKFLLLGYGYRYMGGIGTFLINRFRNNKAKEVIDFRQTAINKQMIINAGKELYDDKEAKIAKANNKEYKGIKYIAYKEIREANKFIFIKSKYWKGYKYILMLADYINPKYRNLSLEEIAKLCKTEENVYRAQIGIRYKAKILSLINPASSIRFYRD